ASYGPRSSRIPLTPTCTGCVGRMARNQTKPGPAEARTGRSTAVMQRTKYRNRSYSQAAYSLRGKKIFTCCRNVTPATFLQEIGRIFLSKEGQASSPLINIPHIGADKG